MTNANPKGRLLIVDDSADTRELLHRNLTSHGYSVLTASNVAEALRILDSVHVDLVITDLKMPGASGLDLVRHIKANLKETEVMMITGYPSIEGAVAAVKSGAEEYLSKPFTIEELLTAVNHAMEKMRLRQFSSEKIEQPPVQLLNIVGNSKAMQNVIKAISKATASMVPVHIAGECGTGKGLIAKAIHFTSSRASAPFAVIDCGNIPEEYFNRHLFGYEGENMPDKTLSPTGFLQFIDGGTLYLKEISELTSRIQIKLVRMIEEQALYQAGTVGSQALNFHIITDSSKNLQVLTNSSFFRQDLFMRLSMNTLHVPALKERENDVLLLSQHFLEKFAREMGKRTPRFSDHAIDVITAYSWPGNVTELQHFIQHLISSTETEIIDVPDFPANMRCNVSSIIEINRSLAEMEYEHIRNVIASVRGNKTRAAEILGINRKTLREKLKKNKT